MILDAVPLIFLLDPHYDRYLLTCRDILGYLDFKLEAIVLKDSTVILFMFFYNFSFTH